MLPLSGIGASLCVAGLRTVRSGCTRVASRTTSSEFTGALSRVIVAVGLLPVILTQFDVVQASWRAILVPFLLSVGLNTAYTYFSISAFREADMSLVSPISAISPALTAIVSAAVLGIVPSTLGIAGIVVTLTGAYIASIPPDAESVVEPVRYVASSRGAQYALLTVAVSAVTPTVDKVGIQQTTPFVWIGLISLGIAPAMLVLLSHRQTLSMPASRTGIAATVLLGVLSLVSLSLQYWAYSIMPTAIVLAIKRVSIPLTGVVGYWVFGEETSIQYRVAGGVITMIGVVILLVS